jgi:hypothetical protein
MNNPIKQRLSRFLTILLSICTLIACGGGGGGGDGGSGSGTAEAKVFTVQVVNIDIRRSSNGERVTVNTASLMTGDLTYE